MSLVNALLATLNSQKGMLKGRTILQKKIYFLSVLSKEDFGYSPHYYGPYSSQVADQLGSLVAAGFILENPQNIGNSPGPFGELTRFDYTLSEAGRKVAKLENGSSIKPYETLLDTINNHAIAEDGKLLSIAAKVHFILSEHGRASISDIQERANSLGWKISGREIQQVVEYLVHLDLVAEN